MPIILAVNPGSTSTKIAVFKGLEQIFSENIEHDRAELSHFAAVIDQYELRLGLVLAALEKHGLALDELAVVVGRGGLLPPLKAGAYEVNDAMLEVLREAPRGEHASNLGAYIAKGIAELAKVRAYVYDPVTVDEMIPLARITGLPSVMRASKGHNLNMRACAIRYAEECGKGYDEVVLVVGHLGGGSSFSLHSGGRMIDMISDDEGPFSPERIGGMPSFSLMHYVLESNQDAPALMRLFRGHSGLYAHFGTSDARAIEAMIDEGDSQAALVYEAMALNIAKGIAALSMTAETPLDAIILTGGLARSKRLTDMVRQRVQRIADVRLMPGENEMEALAAGAFRVLQGIEQAKQFEK